MNYKILLGVLVATGCGFFLHVILSTPISQYVEMSMNGNSVMQPPYPTYIEVIAGLTAIVPVAATAFILYSIFELLPARSSLAKGILF